MLIKPDVTVAMGATAARALFGRPMTIGRARGRAQALPEGGTGWVTVHPSYLLRIPYRAKAAAAFARFDEDIKGAVTLTARSSARFDAASWLPHKPHACRLQPPLSSLASHLT